VSNQHIHHVTTSDGVTLAGTVHGRGPPLVLLHGALGDGDTDWQALLGHLAGRFTCHLPSLRGRGRSDDHHDLSFGRRVEDILAYLGSIQGPTGLVGMSAGGATALVVAAQSDAVNAVAVYEPVLDSLMDEQERAAIGRAVTRMGERLAAGDLPAAARAFGRFVLNDEELDALETAGYFETTGRYAANLLKTFHQAAQQAGDSAPVSPSAADPALLGTISVPALVLHGSNSRLFWARFAQHVADHVPNAKLHEIPGAGHAAPLTHPEALAGPLTDLFTATQRAPRDVRTDGGHPDLVDRQEKQGRST
jgi:pimeloyl-ACP methyl ester carboxylesterase